MSHHKASFATVPILLLLCCGLALAEQHSPQPETDWLASRQLPDLPNELGVAGPFVGVHNGALVIAGGANFPPPTWESDKKWHDTIHVLTRDGEQYQWLDGGTLSKPMAYGAAVSTPAGILYMGGNDEQTTYDDVFLITWDPLARRCRQVAYPRLPSPCVYGQAALIDGVVYLAGGQSGAGLDSAMNNCWALDLSLHANPDKFKWRELPPWPGTARAFNMTVAQHDGFHTSLYVIGGRREVEGAVSGNVEFLTDVWQFTPQTHSWRQRASLPRPAVAGVAAAWGQSHVLVLGGDDGANFGRAEALKDAHPGFPQEALAYHTITDTWTSAGGILQNQVTTIPVLWNDEIVVASGEIRPRVRTPQIWATRPRVRGSGFGAANYAVLIVYLLTMVGIGLFFARRNKDTDDFFRGGKQVPWWAAGCSIFATMLSSLTFTGVPSKAYAQDWVFAVGNMMIPVVAFVGVYVAMPFYRRLDVTSAYEYLEQRFSRPVRQFGSASFVLFHVFRMAVVMSLTGLALAVATPLTPAQSVLLMGVLSIVYSTLGGIEAVIWTDTIQSVVLLGGAMFAMMLLLSGAEGTVGETWALANSSNKLRVANLHWDATDVQVALWVVIVGAIGQNLSSYTADQAVVQRYLTTPNDRLAARSIWTNAVLSIFATALFFGMGTALYAYYKAHPDKLDPTITTDQIFPLFIAREMPIGIAGLVVAGIFSAAQSTVSTSMNSTATTLITDFLRPANLCRTERGYLRAARLATLLVGVLGTAFALIFTNPNTKSLFDTWIMVIGLFMGVLGGLFLLGVLTQRANATGAIVGALAGTAIMFSLWMWSPISGYLYTACGIAVCVALGYLVSILTGTQSKDLAGLTIHTYRTG